MDGRDLVVMYAASIDRAVKMASGRFHVQGADAEDFAQDIRQYFLVHALQIFARFKGDSSVDTYLYTVVARQAARFTHARKVLACRFVSLSESQQERGLAEREQWWLDEAASSQRTARVLEVICTAMRALPRDTREILRRRFISQHDAKAVAASLNLSTKAVYCRQDRALQFIRGRVEAAGISLGECRAALEQIHNDKREGAMDGWMDGWMTNLTRETAINTTTRSIGMVSTIPPTAPSSSLTAGASSRAAAACL